MTDSNRNRNSNKNTDEVNRTGKGQPENRGNKKLPDNPNNESDESISTAGDTSNGKYSRTNKRDEDIDNEDTRGGL